VNSQIAVDWLARRAQLSPHRTALIVAETGEQITYAEWNRRANRVANVFHNMGLKKGDRIAVLAPNSLEYLDIVFACQKTGCILQALNWRLTQDELLGLIKNATPRLLIYSPTLSTHAGPLVKQTSLEFAIALGKPQIKKHLVWNNLISRAATTPPPPVPLTLADPWILCYTGGTTGLPKAAILTQGNITWNAINTVSGWELSADDKTFLNLPLFHTGGLNVFTLPLVHAGGCSIVCNGFDVEQVFDLVNHGGVTTFVAVPTMFIMMQQHPDWEKTDFTRCKTILNGGASCPIPIFERFLAKGATFKTGYGLTEAGPNTFSLPNADVQRKIGSVGFPLMHIDVRIVNSEGTECKPEEVGELLIRGPHVIPGYWNNPQATAETIIDGWLHTGDLARRDAEEYIYIVGRLKDMIISGGENIYPAEIESVMRGHPAIVEATVIGIPNLTWGEVGRAIVVVRPGINLNGGELLDYLRQHLANYKVPKSVIFVDHLPKTAAGKIDKKLLQQQYGGA